jgi:hypothetical protein
VDLLEYINALLKIEQALIIIFIAKNLPSPKLCLAHSAASLVAGNVSFSNAS